MFIQTWKLISPILAGSVALRTRCDSLENGKIKDPEFITAQHTIPSDIQVYKLLRLYQMGFKSSKIKNTSLKVSFMVDDDCVLENIVRSQATNNEKIRAFIRAGPRGMY